MGVGPSCCGSRPARQRQGEVGDANSRSRTEAVNREEQLVPAAFTVQPATPLTAEDVRVSVFGDQGRWEEEEQVHSEESVSEEEVEDREEGDDGDADRSELTAETRSELTAETASASTCVDGVYGNLPAPLREKILPLNVSALEEFMPEFLNEHKHRNDYACQGGGGPKGDGQPYLIKQLAASSSQLDCLGQATPVVKSTVPGKMAKFFAQLGGTDVRWKSTAIFLHSPQVHAMPGEAAPRRRTTVSLKKHKDKAGAPLRVIIHVGSTSSATKMWYGGREHHLCFPAGTYSLLSCVSGPGRWPPAADRWPLVPLAADCWVLTVGC